MGHTVARITALGPDVVLVHRSVARLAQDKLRECGVTLVLNVKLSVLKRVARCTGASIVNTIDAHISARYMLGTCKKFYLRNFPDERSKYNYICMYVCVLYIYKCARMLCGAQLHIFLILILFSFVSFSGGVKTLMYFEGCANPHLGATIVLRGGSQSELKKVKNVTSMMIFTAYSWRLEKSFLMDEFAKPPSPKDNSFLDETSQKDPSNGQESEKLESCIIEQTHAIDVMKKPSKVNQNHESIPNSEQKVQNVQTDIPIKYENVYDSETILSANSLREVSSMLSEDSDPYDTLKLFKTKLKPSLHDSNTTTTSSENETISHNIDKSKDLVVNSLDFDSDVTEVYNNSEELANKEICIEQKIDELIDKAKLKDKISSEEKRIYGESISDRSDPLHQYLNEDDEDVFNRTSPSGQRLSVADFPLFNKFKKALEDTVLSVSPYLKFSIPYLETELGRNCVLRSFFPREIYYSAQFFDKIKETRTNSVSEQLENREWMNIKLKSQHPFVQTRLTTDVDSREVQSLLANFRACGNRIYPTYNVSLDRMQQSPASFESSEQTPSWPDCLDPSSHQRLSVLFCSFSHTGTDTPAFCVNPWVVNMTMYGQNDIALGRFLERYCLTTEYKCPAQNCRAQIAQHVRRFAHDGGCVHISLSEMSCEPFVQEDADQILMWSKCVKCKSVSPVVPMSGDTWCLSFAKYLELRFYGGIYTKRGMDACQHSLHHDHYQYFTRKNMLAVFKFTKISQWEISLPPPLINIIYDPKQHANVIEEMKSVTLKGDEVFTAIREKLTSLQTDLEGLNSAKQQLAKDQQYFKNKIEEIQLKLTSPTLENKKLEGKTSERQVQGLMFRIEDGIVILKRLIAEAVFTWNNKLSEMSAKKKDERPRRFTERSMTVGSNSIVETDGYITEDTASESQVEDLSPMSADYNAIDAIAAAQSDFQASEVIENSDNEPLEPANNPDDVVAVQGSPKMHQRSHSDVLPLSSDDVHDKKKKKKTILSQLLSVSVNHTISNPLGPLEHYLLPLGYASRMTCNLNLMVFNMYL